MANKLFVVPVLNTMGPVTDSKHTDLLNSWEAIDRATSKYFSPQFRNSLIDSHGKGVVVSWFPVSWSGFDFNPVNREFGWFTIYDHLINRWWDRISFFGDGLYWMYNHPDKSAVGNVWGLDWHHNCHYLNILNRMIIERNFFPGVIEIPTANTHSTHFVENYFPFELSNRYSKHINWDNIEADGRKTRDVLQWADAPGNWVAYRPDHENHQNVGNMNHYIFRLLDIKTRIMTFPKDEIVSAFESCMEGNDVIIAGYEHDFRDRCDVVSELFLKPIGEIAKKYPDVEVCNKSMQDAAIECICHEKKSYSPKFILTKNKDYFCIFSNCSLFGNSPYVAVKNLINDKIVHINPTPNGINSWAIQEDLLPERCIVGIAGFSKAFRQSVNKFSVNGANITLLENAQNSYGD